MNSNEQREWIRLEYLKGFTFECAEYTAPRADWDHDHCEGCWAKFASFDAPGILHWGYFTNRWIDKVAEEPEFIKQAREKGQKVLAKPDSKVWVCEACFAKFRAALDWNVKSSAHAK